MELFVPLSADQREKRYEAEGTGECTSCLRPLLRLFVRVSADQREKRYEAEGTGTMYLFRLDSRTVIDATLKVRFLVICISFFSAICFHQHRHRRHHVDATLTAKHMCWWMLGSRLARAAPYF